MQLSSYAIQSVGSTSDLLGSEWEGVYLVERQQAGAWKVLCLDEPLGAAVTF